MIAYGIYTRYLHHDVLRAIVVRKSDAELLAEKWGAVVKQINMPDDDWWLSK